MKPIVHAFSKDLVKTYGLYGAILLRSIVGHIKWSSRTWNGERWYQLKLDQVAAEFPYISRSAIHNILTDLVDKHRVLKRRQEKNRGYDMRYSYAEADPNSGIGHEEKILKYRKQHAIDYGVAEAVIISNLRHHFKEKRKRKAYGWHVFSPSQMEAHLPFSAKVMGQALKKLVKANVLEQRPYPDNKNLNQYRFINERVFLHDVTEEQQPELDSQQPKLDDQPPKMDEQQPKVDDYNIRKNIRKESKEEKASKESPAQPSSRSVRAFEVKEIKKEIESGNSKLSPQKPEKLTVQSLDKLFETHQAEMATPAITGSLSFLPEEFNFGDLLIAVNQDLPKIQKKSFFHLIQSTCSFELFRQPIETLHYLEQSSIERVFEQINTWLKKPDDPNVPDSQFQHRCCVVCCVQALSKSTPHPLLQPIVQLLQEEITQRKKNDAIEQERLSKKHSEMIAQRKKQEDDRGRRLRESHERDVSQRKLLKEIQAEEYKREMKYESPDDHLEHKADLTAEEKLRVFKNYIITVNQRGQWTSRGWSHNVLRTNAFTWELARLFFENNPEISVSHLDRLLSQCIAKKMEGEEKGYDKFYFSRHSTDVNFFFRHLEQVLRENDKIALPFIVPLSREQIDELKADWRSKNKKQ